MQQRQAHHPRRMAFSSSKSTSHCQAKEGGTVYCLSHNVLYPVESKVHILLQGAADMGTDKQSGTGAKI